MRDRTLASLTRRFMGFLQVVVELSSEYRRLRVDIPDPDPQCDQRLACAAAGIRAGAIAYWPALNSAGRRTIALMHSKLSRCLDPAYNLARWITHNDQDAQDVVQDAYLRALRYFDGFHGDDVRPWLLQIVRHAGYSWLAKNRSKDTVGLDESDDAWRGIPGPAAQEPQVIALRKSEQANINDALAALPVAYREVLLLREMEEVCYRDIARIAEITISTVMSRLAGIEAKEALSADIQPRLRSMPHKISP
jgi:RNA polymerase sigma-70 factor (ECF subfamily)